MPRSFGGSLTFAGQPVEMSLTHGLWSGVYDYDEETGRRTKRESPPRLGDEYEVSLPAVLEMLSIAEEDELSPGAVRDALLGVIGSLCAKSGCCPDCDDAFDSYPDALQRYDAAVAGERERVDATTAESHPYVLSNSGKVHDRNCHAAVVTTRFEHPGRTLQEYVHGSPDHEYGPGWQYGGALQAYSAGRAMTTAEMAEWVRGRRSVKRCKLCQPTLPGAFESEASDVEAGRRGG
jgi:hypothetical protein